MLVSKYKDHNKSQGATYCMRLQTFKQIKLLLNSTFADLFRETALLFPIFLAKIFLVKSTSLTFRPLHPHGVVMVRSSPFYLMYNVILEV